MGCITPPFSALAIFYLGIELFSPHLCTIVSYFLLAARLVITRHWKSHLAPNASEVIKLVRANYLFEKLLAL